MYLFAISLAILSSVLYHVFIKLVPEGAHPVIALIATYGTALLICAGLLIFVPLKTSLGASFRQLNWASYALAAALVGLEMAFLLAYRAGWNIGTAAIVVNAVVAITLIPVGLLFFKEQLSWMNITGVFVAIVGLVMMNL